MQSVTFVVDESGAKGYSDNRETAQGELGVVAGVLIPTQCLSKAKFEIEKILGKFKFDGKMHIACLPKTEQECLRHEIFSYLLSVNARWVYEAMYVEGLCSHAGMISYLRDKAKDNRRSSIKVSSNQKKDLLHSELLLGAFGKAVAFCIDYVGNEVFLNVITDQIDSPIVETFRNDANRLLNIGIKREYKVTGFDSATRKVVNGSISIQVTDGLVSLGDFSGISYEIGVSDSPLTVIADVVANSVCYHLLSLQAHGPGCQLNSLEAISSHQLAALVYGVTGQDASATQVADTVFQYPF